MKTSSLAVLPPAGFCSKCAYRGPCGGLDRHPSLFGCFIDCGRTCAPGAGRSCDATCPKRPMQFARRWAEVGGWPGRRPANPLRAPMGTPPRYVPFIRHGSRRDELLDLGFVAVPTFELVGGAGPNYGPRAKDGRDLRARLRLRDDAQLLFVSVAPDGDLEKYWASATELAVPSKIAELNLWGMTAPNYSFFDLVPRTQILYNRARIVCATEALSEAGVPGILHVNAKTSSDWQFWADLLRDHPQIRFVAKEFQTGARYDREVAEQMIAGLAAIQEHVPQDIHPIVVGGTQYASLIARVFRNVTFVDSRPFMNAVHRHRFVFDVLGARWEASPTGPEEGLEELLAHNIFHYARYVDALTRISPSDAAFAQASVEDDDELLVDVTPGGSEPEPRGRQTQLENIECGR